MIIIQLLLLVNLRRISDLFGLRLRLDILTLRRVRLILDMASIEGREVTIIMLTQAIGFTQSNCFIN